jgi:hypothetical protein
MPLAVLRAALRRPECSRLSVGCWRPVGQLPSAKAGSHGRARHRQPGSDTAPAWLRGPWPGPPDQHHTGLLKGDRFRGGAREELLSSPSMISPLLRKEMEFACSLIHWVREVMRPLGTNLGNKGRSFPARSWREHRFAPPKPGFYRRPLSAWRRSTSDPGKLRLRCKGQARERLLAVPNAESRLRRGMFF